MNTFKALFLCIFLFISYLSNSQTITDLNYTVGKKQLEKLNNKVENYEQLSILFDTLKTKFLKEYFKLNRRSFKYDNNNGCTAIADYLMDLAGSYHFDSSNKLQYVGFGYGYPIIYYNIKCRCKNTAFDFSEHRAVKFTLKDKTEYIFDYVISLTKPIKKEEWLEFYKKSNNNKKVNYSETTLKQSLISGINYYSRNHEETIKNIDTQYNIQLKF